MSAANDERLTTLPVDTPDVSRQVAYSSRSTTT